MPNQSLIITILLLLLLGFSSCKKESYNIEYTIENNSLRSLNIIFKKLDRPNPDSNLIASGQSLIFLIESGDNQTSDEFLNGLDSIPVSILTITDTDQNHLAWDEQNLDHWHKQIFDGKKDTKATMTARIRELDFE